MKNRTTFIAASIFALTAVILGAFATHGLKPHLTSDQIETFETGTRYQFMHAMGLFIIGLLSFHIRHKLLRAAALTMALGIILFSGSLYLLSSRALLGIENWTWLGPITPLGGLAFIMAWFLVFIAVWRHKT